MSSYYPRKSFTALIVYFSSFTQVAYAQSGQQAKDLKWVVQEVVGVLMSIVPILSSLALLLFFWGLAEYVFQAGDKGAVETGRNRMIIGIVGLFSIGAVWGLVSLVGSSFNIL